MCCTPFSSSSFFYHHHHHHHHHNYYNSHREVVRSPARQLPALDQTLPQTVTSMLRALLGTLALMEDPAPGKKSTKSGSERLDLIQSDSTNTCISSPLSRTSSSICLSPRPPHFTRPLAAPPERALRQVGASVVVLESTSPILQTHPVPGKYAPRLAPCPCLLPCLTRQILLQLCRRQMARWYGTV